MVCRTPEYGVIMPIFFTFCSYIIGFWVISYLPTLQNLDIPVNSVQFLFINYFCCLIQICCPLSNIVSVIHFCLNSSSPEPPIAIVYRGTTNFKAKALSAFCLQVCFIARHSEIRVESNPSS